MKKFLLFFFVTIATLTFSSCRERIDAGHEGIKVNLYGSSKGVDQDVTLVTGVVWYNPFTTSVYEYPTFVQPVNYEAFTVNTKEGAAITLDPTINIKITDGKAAYIFKKYRKDLPDVIDGPLYNYVKDVCRIAINKYTLDEVVTGREKVENDIEKTLKSYLTKEGFTLDHLTTGLKYPESITKAVIAKTAAIQKAQQATNELAVAEAEAKKKIVAAEAEAEANRLKQAALTPLLIQQQYIAKWNGVLPTYVGTGNPMMMLPNK